MALAKTAPIRNANKISSNVSFYNLYLRKKYLLSLTLYLFKNNIKHFCKFSKQADSSYIVDSENEFDLFSRISDEFLSQMLVGLLVEYVCFFFFC